MITSAFGRASAIATIADSGCALPVGLLGEHTNTTSGAAATTAPTSASPRTKSDGSARCSTSVYVKRARRECTRKGERARGGRQPGPAVGLQQLGQDLVRPVRGPDALDRMHRRGREVGKQPAHLPVGVAVEREVVDRRRKVV